METPMLTLSIFIMILTVALDQLTKWLTVLHLTDGPLKLIPEVLHLTYVENRGAAFGMLADHRWIFLVLSAVAIGAMLIFLIVKRPKDKLLLCSLSLVAGGGIGNMIDRFARGFVVDMIDVTFINFYVFNVADSAVCIGCGLLILYMILDEVKKKKGTAK